MQIQPIQIIAIIFALFAISRVILRVRDKKLTINEFVFWCILWAALIILAIFPTLVVQLSGFLGFKRGLDVLIYVSIAALFYLVFRMYVKIEEQDQKITKLVREIAIKNNEKNKKKK